MNLLCFVVVVWVFIDGWFCDCVYGIILECFGLVVIWFLGWVIFWNLYFVGVWKDDLLYCCFSCEIWKYWCVCYGSVIWLFFLLVWWFLVLLCYLLLKCWLVCFLSGRYWLGFCFYCFGWCWKFLLLCVGWFL